MSNTLRDDTTCTGPQLAAMLKLSDRHVRELVAGGHIVKVARGRYNVTASTQGYITWVREQPSQTESKTAEERRLKQAQAELRELDVAERRRDLIPAEDVKQALLGLAQVFTSGVDGAAPRLARALGGGAAAKKAAVGEVDRIRASIAGKVRELAESIGLGSVDSGTAARTKRKRVGKGKSKARPRGG